MSFKLETLLRLTNSLERHTPRTDRIELAQAASESPAAASAAHGANDSHNDVDATAALPSVSNEAPREVPIERASIKAAASPSPASTRSTPPPAPSSNTSALQSSLTDEEHVLYLDLSRKAAIDARTTLRCKGDASKDTQPQLILTPASQLRLHRLKERVALEQQRYRAWFAEELHQRKAVFQYLPSAAKLYTQVSLLFVLVLVLVFDRSRN